MCPRISVLGPILVRVPDNFSTRADKSTITIALELTSANKVRAPEIQNSSTGSTSTEYEYLSPASVNTQPKGSATGNFGVFFHGGLNNLLHKWSISRWFATLIMWRHCKTTVLFRFVYNFFYTIWIWHVAVFARTELRHYFQSIVSEVTQIYHIFCLSETLLTHWGRVTHICVSKLTTTGSENGCRLVGAKPLSEPMLVYC